MMKLKKRKLLIFCVCGKARSGKSLVGKYINDKLQEDGYKIIVSPYTKYLKKYISEITGQEITDDNKPRDLLQQISSEIIKGELGNNNFFINRQIEDIDLYSYFFDIVIIPDVRFPKEIEVLKERYENVISIGVNRVDYKSDLTLQQQKDKTEISLDNYQNYDFLLINENIEKLRQDTLKIINNLKKEGII